MRKLLVAVVLSVFGVLPSLADTTSLGEQITATLLDHVQTMAQFTTEGDTRLALLDSVVQVGKYNGSYIAGLQLGFSGETAPDAGDPNGVNYLAGVQIRLDPLFRQEVTVPEHWSFLRALEFGPGFHYDFRERHSFLNFQVGLAFTLNPKKI